MWLWISVYSPAKEYFVAVFDVITERKLADLKLREALKEAQNLRMALDHVVPFVYRKDAGCRYLYANQSTLDLFGCPAEELAGSDDSRFFPEVTVNRLREVDSRVLQGESTMEEIDVTAADGRRHVYWEVQTPIYEPSKGKTITGLLGISTDITERKQMEEALRKNEEMLQTLFREMLDGFALHEVLCDGQGNPTDDRFIDVNPAFERITGLKAEEIVGRTVLEVLPGTERQWIETYGKVALSGEPAFFENYAAEMKKHFTVAAFRPAPNQFACILADITERKLAKQNMRQIEARLRQSEKMEAVGQLAGGIAHDFNNVLAGIMGYTEMTLPCVGKGSVGENNLLQVLKAADRARKLVQQILTFSRQGNPQMSITDLRLIVQEVLDLLRASIPSSATIESDLHPDTKPVMADATKLHEVLLNLATNAVHAMSRKGTLIVKLNRTIIDQSAFGRTGEIKAGQYTVLEVTDNGCGMDERTLSKAFEPFFTTKAVGEGTGMGLSVVLGVVQSHGGDLQVESSPGKGSTFRIFLPAAEMSDSGDEEGDNSGPMRGSERILFVDDEPMLVRMAEDLLGKLGYDVIVLPNSPDAFNFMKEKHAEIDLLITDHTMPMMTGMELAKAVLTMRKDLPIILCTGYSSEVSQERAMGIGIRRVVMKPNGAKEISKVIREVLENGM